MKRILRFIYITLLIFLLVSCDFSSTFTGIPADPIGGGIPEEIENPIIEEPEEPKEPSIEEIQFLSMNDTHGYLEDSNTSSMAKAAKFIKDNKDNEENNTIVLSIGDMFQGTAISNITRGKAMVEVMNEIGFDSMVIGNHEFDWGIEEISKFNDGDLTNGEADFSFLACNIVYKGTTNLLEFTKPYEIYEHNGVKVGVVGVIGNVYNSISVSKVKDFEFLDPVASAKKYIKELRNDKNCDIVVVGIHYGNTINNQFTSLKGEYQVDAIFNSHTHQLELVQTPIVQIQAKANGEYVAEVKISYDVNNKKIVSAVGKNYQVSSMTSKDNEVASIINSHVLDIEDVINEELTIFSASSYDREQIATYGSNVICNAFDVDFAMVNSGMYRYNFYSNQVITYGDMIQMVPFDNEIKLVTLYGHQIRKMYNMTYDLVEYPKMISGQIYTAKGELLVDNQKYRVGAVDYVFDKTYYEFVYGEDIEFTSTFIRDILVLDLKEISLWNYYNPAVIGKIEW